MPTPARKKTASTEKTVSQNDTGRPDVLPEPPPQPRLRAPSATSASSPSTPRAITTACAPGPPPRRFTGSTPGLCRSDEHGQRLALGLELGALDVTEVLAVRLERQRPVADDLDPVEVVRVRDVRAAQRRAPGREVGEQARDVHRPDRPRRHEVEPELE